jgi:hypothetical protein
VAEHLCVFSNAGDGLVRQVRHNVRGHGVFLLGEVHPRAVWYYFPVALLIKLPLPLLALPLLLALVRPAALGNWACLAAAALLAFSVTCRVQIGVRLVLPLVVLAVVGLAAGAVGAGRALRDGAGPGWLRGRGHRLLAGLLAAAVLGTAASAARVWPHGLCYTNELWGGVDRGYLCLSDSNYDWGQGLKDLARWQRRHGGPALDVWYFGSDPALKRLPLRQVGLQALPAGGPDDVRGAVRGHYLAVSTTLLYGMPCDTEPYRRASAFLRGCRPVARTRTFLIYDFRRDGEARP